VRGEREGERERERERERGREGKDERGKMKYWVVQKVIAFFSFDFQVCLFNIHNVH